MPSHIKYEAVATIGEYTDRSGEKKKRYVNLGKVFEDDQGRLSLKLDTIPIGPNWSGWVSFYEPKERQDQGRDRTPQDAYRQPSGQGPATPPAKQSFEEAFDEPPPF